MKDAKKAIEIAEKALAEAVDELENLNEEEFKDAQSIVELLRENVSIWKEAEDL
eukprot:CAMPEP_0202961412 /NCGR_PEP_ID=MMETSP1396-20130829/5463_1 /ASSEMBLY_ACC=CAM_ASM_000872 /TAXON_ID= /ORGANISM="Pseudokeronopsis sp., Strain Brazil" /LENGTH=53 /DNA_ID=CAMNT_0049681201 /DNA_START=535 /DNA_END=696 /DNA_ORIENTATION=-